MNLKYLEEAKDLSLYKALVKVLSDYDQEFPSTGIADIMTAVLKKKLKVLPADAVALSILQFVISNGSAPYVVNSLLNLRFSDLPQHLSPVYEKDGSVRVAFWGSGGKVNDRVVSLLNTEKESDGHWVDQAGQKVRILNQGAN